MADVTYWWQGRKFKHPETGHMVKFKSLPLETQRQLNDKVKSKDKQKAPKTKAPDTSLIEEAKKYKSVEEFKARGFEAIQKKLFGVNTGDIVKVPINQIEIIWKDDLENAEQLMREQDITEETEPVEFHFDIKKNKYILDDGHNRYVAARRQGIPLKGEITATIGNMEEMADIFKEKTGYSISDIWNKANKSEGKKSPKTKAPAGVKKDVNKFLKWRVPEIKSIKDGIVTTKDNRIEFQVTDIGDMMEIYGINVEGEKGTGIGIKLVQAVKDFADLNWKGLKVVKPYNHSFWKKFNITEDKPYTSLDSDNWKRVKKLVEGKSMKIKMADITVPLDVGDEIMVGRFKNKKVVVKGFGTDDKGQPTLKTDKGEFPLFKFKVKKWMP